MRRGTDVGEGIEEGSGLTSGQRSCGGCTVVGALGRGLLDDRDLRCEEK